MGKQSPPREPSPCRGPCSRSRLTWCDIRNALLPRPNPSPPSKGKERKSQKNSHQNIFALAKNQEKTKQTRLAFAYEVEGLTESSGAEVAEREAALEAFREVSDFSSGPEPSPAPRLSTHTRYCWLTDAFLHPFLLPITKHANTHP
jgi:biotin carboxyl carrier protein